MDQEQWEQQSKPISRGGGSVKRARERAAMGGDSSQIPSPSQRGQPSPPRNAGNKVPMNRIRPPMPIAFGSKGGQGLAGVAISRPLIHSPQWPLGGTMDGRPYQGADGQFQQPQVCGPDPRSIPQYSPPKNRGPAPKRPPRPSQVPQMPDDQPDFIFAQPRRYSSGMPSPEISSRMTQSSVQSILSSVGSIPDFPSPAPPPLSPAPARKSAYLGPPPSSRRSASSYYSQTSFVLPIPEESPRPSHQSYASSAAIPSSWGSRSPQYDYSDDDDAEYENEDVREYSRYQNGTIDEVRGESRASYGDDSDDRGLIRSASIGRRAQPSMIVTKCSASIEPTRPLATPHQNMPQERKGSNNIGLDLAPPNMPAVGQRDTFWPSVNPNDPLTSGTGLVNASVSSSETVPTVGATVTINEPSPSYTPQPADPKTNEMLGAYNQASSLNPGGVLPLGQPSPLRQPSPGFSQLSAFRRPPSLNIDAVRDAEARGSLTSLPDLIARATRLTSLMDRGKRPGSRMVLDDWGSVDKETGNLRDEKHKSNLSGMLAAFPPPGIQTPRDGTPIRPNSPWPSGYGPSGLNPNEKLTPRRRRYCGLPIWGFFIVSIILLIILATAIVVPLQILVFNKKTTSAVSLTAVQKCEASTISQCHNGGTSIITSGACSCICTNGFTGSTCTSANATGCSTTSLAGVTGNVTLGNAIERLLTGAQNFSIPLEAQTVIGRFNSESLSCATENALVTFDGESGRVGSAADLVKGTASTSASSTATPAVRRNKQRHDDTSFTSSSTGATATASSVIVFDSNSPLTTTPDVSSLTVSGTDSSVNSSANFAVTEEVLDFARVAVLYILQEGTLNGAVNAQSTLQRSFMLESFTNQAAANVTLGTGVWADLLGFTIDAGAGVVGGLNTTVDSRKRTDGGEEMARRERGRVGRSVPLWHV